jgi:polygalacturonase
MRFLLFTFFVIISKTSLFAKDYNILDFGAIPDGKTLNTVNIQSAIDAAHDHGGGRVVVPAGRFLSGTILMKSGVELHLLEGAVLLGSTDPTHYIDQSKWKTPIISSIKLSRWQALVMADSQENIAITGKGEIDGQGRQLALHIDSLFYAGQIDSADYDFAEKRPQFYLRPQLIIFVNCKNIGVKNMTLKNAASWVQTYDQCEGVIIDSVRVDSDAYWNNDGIDISDCKNVRVTNCFVNAADDGICLKSHSAEHECDNIYIANCTVRSSASAIKIGTRSHGGFKNVTIEHIKVYDTFRSAVAIECVDGGTLENVLVDNVQAVNTGNAIFIRLGKRNQTGAPGTLRNVTLKNIRVEVAFKRPDYAYEIRGPELPFFHNTFPSSITGIPGHPVENITLENIEIIYPGKGNNGLANLPLSRLDDVPEKMAEYPEFSMFGELPAWGFYVRHVDGFTLKNIQLTIEAPDYRPALVFDDVRNLEIKVLTVQGETKQKHIILHKTENVKVDNEQNVLRK